MARVRRGFIVFVLSIIAIAVIGGGWYVNKEGLFDSVSESTSPDDGSSSVSTPAANLPSAQPVAPVRNVSGKPLRVMTVPYPGAGPLVWMNGGFKPNKSSWIYRNYGILLDIRPTDVVSSVPLWAGGDLDFIINTVDVLPVLSEGNAEIEPRGVMTTDVSRGGDQWVVPPEIQTIDDLKGRLVAVSRPSPSFSLGLYGLDYHGKPLDFVEWSPQPDPTFCTKQMLGGWVDGGAIVWSPDQYVIMEEVPGAHVIYSTKEANQLIRNEFVCKQELLDKRGQEVQAFVDAWFTAVYLLKNNESEWNQMIHIMASEFANVGFPYSEDEWRMAMDDFYLCTYGDNLRYMNVKPSSTVPTNQDIYDQFTTLYTRVDEIRNRAVPWREMEDTRFVRALSDKQLSGYGWDAEGVREFAPATPDLESKQSFALRSVNIQFETNSAALDEIAVSILDRRVVDAMRKMGGAYVRIEGHTDATGNRAYNMQLSRERALSVRDYLVNLGFDPDRFIVKGVGPDRPVADNSTDAGRQKNRRVEFHLLASDN